jgi:hypothetical protein
VEHGIGSEILMVCPHTGGNVPKDFAGRPIPLEDALGPHSRIQWDAKNPGRDSLLATISEGCDVLLFSRRFHATDLQKMMAGDLFSAQS